MCVVLRRPIPILSTETNIKRKIHLQTPIPFVEVIVYEIHPRLHVNSHNDNRTVMWLKLLVNRVLR